MNWHQFKTGLSNLAFYFWTIWNDRQWDHGGMYYLLSKKLERMEQFWRSDEPAVADQAKVLREIRYARMLCRRLTSEQPDPAVNYPESYTANLHDLFNGEGGRPKLCGYPSWALHGEHKHRTGNRQTVALLARQLQRHSLGWWD